MRAAYVGANGPSDNIATQGYLLKLYFSLPLFLLKT